MTDLRATLAGLVTMYITGSAAMHSWVLTVHCRGELPSERTFAAIFGTMEQVGMRQLVCLYSSPQSLCSFRVPRRIGGNGHCPNPTTNIGSVVILLDSDWLGFGRQNFIGQEGARQESDRNRYEELPRICQTHADRLG